MHTPHQQQQQQQYAVDAPPLKSNLPYLLPCHVIRRMRSCCVRIFNGNQRETLSLITQERIGVGASNLVGIIDVGVDAGGILSRSVCQTNRKYKYGGHSAYKMQKSMEKRLQIAEISSAVSYEVIAS